MGGPHPDGLAVLNDIELWATQFHSAYRVGLSTAGPATIASMQGTVIEQLQAGISRAQVENLRELADFLEDVIRAMNAGRILATCLAARAAIETVAALSHVERGLKRLLATPGGAGQLEVDEARALLNQDGLGGRMDWERWWGGPEQRRALISEYESQGKAEIEARPTRTNVMGLLAALDQRYGKVNPERKGRVAMYYAMLSDVAHPSLGRHLLYFSPASPSGWANTLAQPAEAIVAEFEYDVILPALWEALTHARAMAREFRSMAESLREVRTSPPGEA